MAAWRLRWSRGLRVMVLLAVVGIVMLILHHLLQPRRVWQQIKSQRLVEVKARTSSPRHHPSSGSKPASTKVVLMHSFPAYYSLQSGRGVFSACNLPCMLTLDPQLLQEADMVVMFTHYFRSSAPLPSSARQIWVYFAVESPLNSNNDVFAAPQWRGRFNWTMTYRHDSDFYFGYGDFVKLASPVAQRDSSFVEGKSKMVAWFVSNCHTQSQREDFAAALKKFVDVDVYGACGPLKCGQGGDPVCMDMLSRDYHFYLAFENSWCQDYVTEKLYRTMRMVDIVPVVRGAANYTSLLPPHSFIDASDFPSVKALAEHLKRVAEDKTLYRSYFAWKQQWTVVEPVPFPFCEMCRRLHHADSWSHVYPNVDAWWREGICHEPPALVKS